MPKCGNCPVAIGCRSTSQPGRRPAKLPRAKSVLRDVTWPLAVVQHRGKILLRRRQAAGLLAKLWELPGCEITPTEKPEAAIRKELGSLSVTGMMPQRLGELRHSITNRRIHAPVLLYRWPVSKPAPLSDSETKWIYPTALRRYATSSMTNKAVKLYLDYEKSPA
jgi:A/G-specific adenine glycosylase